MIGLKLIAHFVHIELLANGPLPIQLTAGSNFSVLELE